MSVFKFENILLKVDWFLRLCVRWLWAPPCEDVFGHDFVVSFLVWLFEGVFRMRLTIAK